MGRGGTGTGWEGAISGRSCRFFPRTRNKKTKTKTTTTRTGGGEMMIRAAGGGRSATRPREGMRRVAPPPMPPRRWGQTCSRLPMVPQSWRRTTPIDGEDQTRWASSFIVPSIVCALMVALAIAGFFIFYRRKQRQRADGDDRKGEDDGIDDNEGGFAMNA